MVTILINAPKSIKVLPMKTLSIVTDTIGVLGLAYFTIMGVSKIYSNNWPTRCMVGGSFFQRAFLIKVP